MQDADTESSDRPAGAITRRWRGISRFTRWWWGVGLGLILAVVLVSQLAENSCLQALAILLLALWTASTVFLAFRWIWRKLTYRIGVRLLVSYFLIGVVPFPLLLVLLGLGGYLLLGQYASAELGDVSRDFSNELVRRAEQAVAAGAAEGPEAARRTLADQSTLGGPLADAQSQYRWLYSTGGKTWRSDNAATEPGELEMPAWLESGVDSGTFLTDDGPVLAAIARRGEHAAAALLPLGSETAEQWSAGGWYEVSFSVREVTVDDQGFHIGPSRAERASAAEEAADESDGTPREGTPAGAPQPGEPPPGEADDKASEWLRGEGWVERTWLSRWIVFLRPSPELRRWEDGSPVAGEAVTALIRTSPREVADDLFSSPYDFGRAVAGVFLGFASFFWFVYLAVVLLAALQIFAITRSTARLTKGTRRVQAGDLTVRIPVKRRDQLGDLAVAFNQMTESVEKMISEVEEKERLKHELELAREIQQSLLPARHLEHGSVSVHAVFRPAAEVGGDYFDLFPLEGGRLIVAAGDVAGHGLSTGLLMAMVKSAVATLVHEGHRGVALLEGLNHFMLQQPREHRMVTLAVAEIDVAAGFAEITNAAHPPVFLSGGTVREVLLPALPVGFPWRQPPPSERLELEAGSRLVFYSDGLVEAVDDDDEAFGYDRLWKLLTEHGELPPEELLATLLAALEHHSGGRPLDDDLTILVIDCGKRSS
ncbi:MAG: SpoIIE family protein phosphatase [bacterium]|nr:SpoIIE family protein phosphatase [bacterium]